MNGEEFIKFFKTLPTNMQIQVINEPPPNTTSQSVFKAIISLEYKSRNKVIKSISKNVLTRLIRSLPELCCYVIL